MELFNFSLKAAEDPCRALSPLATASAAGSRGLKALHGSSAAFSETVNNSIDLQVSNFER